jgi:hypothetical protein
MDRPATPGADGTLQRELVRHRRQLPVTLRGLRKQKIGARKQGAAHNRSYLTSSHKGHQDTIAMLQWLIQNGPLVAWAFAGLVTGFTVLTGMV